MTMMTVRRWPQSRGYHLIVIIVVVRERVREGGTALARRRVSAIVRDGRTDGVGALASSSGGGRERDGGLALARHCRRHRVGAAMREGARGGGGTARRGREGMPVSAYTLTDSWSACTRALTRMREREVEGAAQLHGVRERVSEGP